MKEKENKVVKKKKNANKETKNKTEKTIVFVPIPTTTNKWQEEQKKNGNWAKLLSRTRKTDWKAI